MRHKNIKVVLKWLLMKKRPKNPFRFEGKILEEYPLLSKIEDDLSEETKYKIFIIDINIKRKPTGDRSEIGLYLIKLNEELASLKLIKIYYYLRFKFMVAEILGEYIRKESEKIDRMEKEISGEVKGVGISKMWEIY